MINQQNMTEEEQQQWVRSQYQVATKYLANKGLVTDSVSTTESRYLVPIMAVWKLKLLDKTSVWVICGDLPTDHINSGVATNARDVLRYFSFKWQKQADNLLATGEKTQEEFAKILIGRAEGLYGLFEKEEIWAQVS